VESGADAIGLVFYPDSPRAVSVEQAQAVAAAVPPFVTVVGLFVDAASAAVSETLQAVPLGMLQFHGSESAAFCRQFHRPWIKALRVRSADDIAAGLAGYQGAAGVLLDAWQEGVPGGTGKTFDWGLVQQQRARPVVLAGGLNADNVGRAVTTVRPFAVDVSGGVESSRGVKDPTLIREFIAAVRRADTA
jgi:phosphoribosylanthranilate isomerase